MTNAEYRPSLELDKLRKMLRSLPESPGVLRLNCEIPGFPNFFPGGRGYRGPEFPKNPVMFIGHNFDTDIGFKKSVERGHEDYLKMKTWVNMLGSFLPAADGLKLEECFFTNFYLGAMIHPEPRPGEKKKTTNTGTFRCSEIYRTACTSALKTQIHIVRPRAIALLGGNVPPAFAEAFPVFKRHLGADLSQTQLKQPQCGHRIQLSPDLTCQVVCLVHPANPRSLESHREQGALLGRAVKAAGTT